MSEQICKVQNCGRYVHPYYQTEGYCEDHYVERIGRKIPGGTRARYYLGKPKHYGQGKRNDKRDAA